MKHIYMSLSITYYSNIHRISCTYYERIDDGAMTSRKLTPDEARKLQWELVKAGAERRVTSNMYTNTISNVDIDYWMEH